MNTVTCWWPTRWLTAGWRIRPIHSGVTWIPSMFCNILLMRPSIHWDKA